MKVLLVALGWILTFLHASWVGEKTCRAKSNSIREKNDRRGDIQDVMAIKTDTITITTDSFRWAERVLFCRFRSSVNLQGNWKHVNTC